MNSAGDAFAFPFRSPDWVVTIILQALILIIPIVGQIALLGWLIVTVDNLRAGRQELAPAGFHLGRGIALFGVEVIYGVALFIIPGVLQGIGSAIVGRSAAAGSLLISLAVLLEVAASLLFAFLLPVLIMRTSEFGFGGGMDVGAVWQQATTDVAQTVVAALLVWVAGIIAGLGIIVCFVGVFLTSVYAHAVMAGVVSWYERTRRVSPGPSAAV
jgi:hypothetical protein